MNSKPLHPDNKVHGANIGPTWVLSAPDEPDVGPMNLGIRATMHMGCTLLCFKTSTRFQLLCICQVTHQWILTQLLTEGCYYYHDADQGRGLLSGFPPFRYFPHFSTSPKYMLSIEYHVRVWQVSLQLSCSDTCQIWMRLKKCNKYFCEIKNFAYREIDEWRFSNPHPSMSCDTIQANIHTETEKSSPCNKLTIYVIHAD